MYLSPLCKKSRLSKEKLREPLPYALFKIISYAFNVAFQIVECR